MTRRPTSVEPVKPIFATSACSISRCPTTEPLSGEDVDDAVRDSRLEAELGEPQRGERRQLGGLEDDRVAAGERGPQLLGVALRAAGNLTRGRRVFEESIALCRELSLSRGLCWALCGLGRLECDEGRHERAAELLHECLRQAAQADDLESASLGEYGLADLCLDQSDFTRATGLYSRSLAHFWVEGEYGTVAACIGGLAATKAAVGQTEGAGRLWGALERLEEARAARLPASWRTRYETVLTGVDQDALARAIAHGREMTLEEAVEYALAQD
jgi:tetratricopeptide (TPR) repeat protein